MEKQSSVKHGILDLHCIWIIIIAVTDILKYIAPFNSIPAKPPNRFWRNLFSKDIASF